MDEIPELEDAGTTPEKVEKTTEKQESFSEVKRKRKRRGRVTDMDTEGAEAESKDDDVAMSETPAKRPSFPPVDASITLSGKSEFRQVPVPPHRLTPLRENWMKIFTPIVEHLKLQIRFNVKTRNVEIKTSKITTDIGSLQKAADFVKAFMLGFDVEDALALVRLDDLFVDSFEVTDVKPLKGDHLSRAIGRIAGTGGKTKFTIENVTKTRMVLADSKVHILGSFKNIRIARNAVCSLILGSPPSKVYGSMRAVASRASERF